MTIMCLLFSHSSLPSKSRKLHTRHENDKWREHLLRVCCELCPFCVIPCPMLVSLDGLIPVLAGFITLL